MDSHDINLINGGHIIIENFDNKANYPFRKEALMHVEANIDKKTTVILERSEMIELLSLLQESLMHYPRYRFTATMFENAINALKATNKVAPDFRMLRYKNNMALAYSEIEELGFLFVANSDNYASAFSFDGDLRICDEYTNEPDFEFCEIRGFKLEQRPEYCITYIGNSLYFGK